MAAMKGATLQKVNNEIVKAIEHLQLQESTLQDEVSKVIFIDVLFVVVNCQKSILEMISF